MLPDIVGLAGSIGRVTGETRVRHVLLVDGPAHALGLEEVNDGGHAASNVEHAVGGHAECGASYCGYVVGLFSRMID